MDGGWFGMFAPAGTPPAIVEKLNHDVRTALADPGVNKRFEGLGVTAAPTTPEEFRKFLAEETKKYAEYVRLAGVQQLD
jgi:tripartite-type tricarboxylate transporter receptor subunit TctC